MRPIVKKQPGESVQYTDSRGNVVDHVVQTNYEEYGDAKLPLVGNIDRYCSIFQRNALESIHSSCGVSPGMNCIRPHR